MKTKNSLRLSSLSSDELIAIIQKQQKQLDSQYHLLKETFQVNQQLTQKLQEIEKQNSSDSSLPNLSWVSKIVFTLKTENRPLKSSELIRILERKEPMLSHHHNKVGYFSAFLTHAVRYERIVQQKVKGVRGYYYLLPQWISEGKVMAPYHEMML